MNFKVGILVLLILGIFTTSDASITVDTVSVGNPAPDFTLYDFYNNSVEYNMSTFAGKVVLLDMMASWCGPCQDSMPEMIELYHAFEATGEFDIISIGIDKSEPDSDLEWFHETFGMFWKFSRDFYGAMPNNGSVWGTYGTGYIPTYYLIDKSGTVVYSEIGWAGIDAWYDTVSSHIDAVDSEAPVITSGVDSFSGGDQAEFNVAHPDLDFEVNVTDNWSVKQVSARIEAIGTNFSKGLNHISGNTWTGSISLTPEFLVGSDNVNISYTASDYSGNSVTTASQTVKFSAFSDTTPPKLYIASAKYKTDTSPATLEISVGAEDDIYLLLPQVILTEPCDGQSNRYEMVHDASTLYSLSINLENITSLDGYLVEIELKDLGGNVVKSEVNVDGITPHSEYSCGNDNSSSAKVTTTNDTTQSAPFTSIIVIVLGLMIVIPIRIKKSMKLR